MSDNDGDDFRFPVRVEGDISSIPAQYRGIYRQNPDDGSMELLPSLAKQLDTSGYQNALKRAREDTKLAEQKGRERVKKVLEAVGVESPEDVPTAIERLRAASANTGTIEETFRRRETELRTSLAAKDAEAAKLRKELNDSIVGDAVTHAIAAAKGNVRTLLPHVRGSVALKEEGGRYFARVVDSDGEIRYGTNGPMTVEEYVQELRADRDFANLFEGSGSTGTGARGAGGSLGGGGARATQSYSLQAWREKLAKCKPDERGELMRAKAQGRITVSD